MSTSAEAQATRDLARYLKEIGPSEAVDRYLRRYTKVRVRRLYAFHLALYFRWLKRKGALTTPDELVVDNLRCIYKSEPEDVATKRRHREWLEEYVNVGLGRLSESSRRLAVAAVKGLYLSNDSPLFGRVAVSLPEARDPPRTPKADDIRRVLKALPLGYRAPLLCEWQSGMEINRVLGLRWKDVHGYDTAGGFLKLSFNGRKKHRKRYGTYVGRDTIEHLRLWRERWEELAGAQPGPDDLVFLGKTRDGAKHGMDYNWINRMLKETAMKLARQGLLENRDPASWHSHMLRHSFKTEAEHAGVKSAIVEYFMGHEGGIEQVYDDRDQLHPEDFEKAYLTIEPRVSLDYTEAVMSERFEEERRTWITEIASLRREVARLAGSTPRGPPDAGQGPPGRTS